MPLAAADGDDDQARCYDVRSPPPAPDDLSSRELPKRCKSPIPRLDCSSSPEAQPVKDLRSIATARRPEVRALLAVVAAALAVLLVVVAVVQVRNFVQGIGQPVSGKTIDRSGPVILQSVRDLARYEAAAGNFQVIVDLEKDAAFLPTAIVGQRTLFVAVGSVNAYVDFSGLGKDAITVTSDRQAVALRLPHATLDKPNLDHQRSYVFAQERGIVDRVRAFFDQAPNQQAELYQVAERKIADAATQSRLTDRAEANTRLMLQDMLRSLGYKQVTITFG